MLPHEPEAALFQLPVKTELIGRLQQAGADLSMDSHPRADDAMRGLVQRQRHVLRIARFMPLRYPPISQETVRN